MKGEKAEPAAGEDAQDRARFIMGTVFDVSQTDAIPVEVRREPHRKFNRAGRVRLSILRD